MSILKLLLKRRRLFIGTGHAVLQQRMPSLLNLIVPLKKLRKIPEFGHGMLGVRNASS